MNRWLFTATLCTSLSSLGGVAYADAPAPFSDATCPQANDAGRKINALNAAGNISGDELMAASQDLVDAYKDCVSASDHSQYSKNANHQSDYVAVTRVYSRLQLARSYQRIGSYYDQLHQADKAKAAYDAALTPLGEINGIVSDGSVGLIDRTSPQVRLRAEGQELHDEIVASEAKLSTTSAPAPEAIKH